jgi:AcrR family transcriptional regulator
MEKKRAAIVDAARTAFLESSYAETSMDSIAKAAKVGIKTVYRLFEDKDDLFTAVIQAAGEEETPAWFAHPPSGPHSDFGGSLLEKHFGQGPDRSL